MVRSVEDFDSTDFGYREIRVERPLRLNFQANAERIERLKLAKSFLKLDLLDQEVLLGVTANRLPDTLFKERPAFDAALTKALKDAGVKIGAPVRKAILSALSERDETAAICLDSDGKPEPDPELRDFELVPLKEDWKAYLPATWHPLCPTRGWTKLTGTTATNRSAASATRSTSTAASIVMSRRAR